MLVLMMALPPASANGQESPYTDFAGRETKSLSPEQIEQYLEGKGMGLALAGELNGYPGPKHVLELAQELGLSLAQRGSTEELFETMQAEAQRLGREIVEQEILLDAQFANGEIDEARLKQITEEIGRLNGRLRGVHLNAHLEMKKVLTRHQAMLYQSARGYGEHRRHSGHGGQR
jgi:Spy/CpxP family protein refolding chaperone